MSFDQKIQDKGILYPLSHSSIGRFNIIGLLSEELGLNLEDSDLREIGNRAQERLILDLPDCVDGVNDILNKVYHRKLLPFDQIGFFRPTTESEFIEFYANKKILVDKKKSDNLSSREEVLAQLKLDSLGSKNLRKFQQKDTDLRRLASSPVELYLLEGDSVDLNFRTKRNTGIEAIIFSRKNVVSLARKSLLKFAKLLNPNEKDLRNYFDIAEFTTFPETTQNIYRREVRNLALNLFKEHIFSDIEACDFLYNHLPVLIRQGIGADIGGNFKQNFDDCYLVDGVRAKIVTGTDEERDNLVGVTSGIQFSEGSSYGILKHRFEPEINEKDGSATFGFSGFSPASYFEIKLQSLGGFFRGEFGSSKPNVRPHFNYNNDRITDLRKQMNSSTMNLLTYKSTTMYGIKREDLFRLDFI